MSENRIGSERTRMRLTQTDLGKLCGVKSGAVSKWEKNIDCIPTKHLKTLAEFFGCSADYLLGIEEERK